MLILKIPEQEYYNNVTGEFINCRACTLKLEHSLVSISKWESKWKKPFLTQESKTAAEFIDYIRCMTINQDVPEEVYGLLGHENVKKIEEYAEDVLGLRPLNRSQIEYIQLQTEDEVTVSEPEDNFFVTVNDYLVSIWEFLRGK